MRTILILIGFLPFLVLAETDNQWGEWFDDTDNTTFNFLPDNVLQYSVIEKKYVKHEGIGNWMSGNYTRGKTVAHEDTFEGGWETGKNVCPGGDLQYFVTWGSILHENQTIR